MSSILSLQGKTGTYSPVEQAEREGRTFREWADHLTLPTTDPTILTNTAFNLPANSILFITKLWTNIETFSDTADFVVLKCTGVNGSGTTTQMHAHIFLASAAAGIGFAGERHEFHPNLIVKYSDGWRSVVIQAEVNDTDAVITAGIAGYWEIVTI